MSACTGEGDSSCSVDSDDDSESALEGQWLGISIGVFFLLIFIAWLFRTLSSPHRRSRLISKFKHCCKAKSPEDGDMSYPSADHNGHSTPHRNSSAKSTLERGRSTGKQQSQPVVYYKPNRPSLPAEYIPRAGVSVPTELDHFGHFITEYEDGDGLRSPAENGGHSIPGRPRPRHARGMRKSWSAVSMTSCNLAPIQEVDDCADSDPTQRARERVTADDTPREVEGQQSSTPLGRSSKSHPDRLSSLAVYSDEDEEEEKEEREKDRVKDGDVDKSNGRVTQMDPKGVGDTLGLITVEIPRKSGHVNVNFVHGSDDEESVG